MGNRQADLKARKLHRAGMVPRMVERKGGGGGLGGSNIYINSIINNVGSEPGPT